MELRFRVIKVWGADKEVRGAFPSAEAATAYAYELCRSICSSARYEVWEGEKPLGHYSNNRIDSGGPKWEACIYG